MPELTVEEWRIISVLLDNMVKSERAIGLHALASKHQATWDKIQPVCQWEDE